MWLLEASIRNAQQIMFGAADEDYFCRRATFASKFAFIPRRCSVSSRWVWGRAVLGVCYITGPGDPVVLHRWYHPQEFLLWRLKKS